MVLELARFDIKPGSEDAFTAAFHEACGLVRSAAGCRSARMTRGIETPTSFVLLVEWESLAAHEDFRASASFPAWRALIGPHFAGPPVVEHAADV